MEFLDSITEIFLSGIIFISNFLAGLIVMIGIIRAILIYLKKDRTICEQIKEVRAIRIIIGNAFSLSLSIFVGASILKTALNPGWNEIGILAAIILLRTFLNYVLLHNTEEAEKGTEDSIEE